MKEPLHINILDDTDDVFDDLEGFAPVVPADASDKAAGKSADPVSSDSTDKDDLDDEDSDVLLEDDLERPLWQKIIRVLSLLLFLAAIGMAAWPFISDAIAHFQAEHQFSQSTASDHNAKNDPKLAEVLAQAQAYNRDLGGGEAGMDLWPYERQLISDASMTMGWLEIPKIGLKAPIYHGTSDAVLMVGVGHMEKTSLPVGGETCHTVLTGHSGMSGMRMFDSLDHMKRGDAFVIWVLGEPYAYRIYDIELVEPAKVENLKMEVGRDLCTLVTCRPIGINSHRLLLHAERCEYDPAEMNFSVGSLNDQRTWLFICACAVLALFLIAMGIAAWMRHRQERKDKDLEEAAVIAQMRDEAAAAGHGSGGTTATAKDTTQSGLSQKSADQGAYGHGRFDRYMEDDDNPPPKLRIRK